MFPPRLCLIALLPVLLLVFSCGLDEPQDPLSRKERAWLEKHGPVKVGMQKDFPPFSFLDSSGTPRGFSIDLWRYMAGRLGFEVQFIPDTMKGIMAGLKDDKFDSLAGIFPLQRRKAFFDFSMRFFPVATSIFVNAKITRVYDLRDLDGLRVGAVEEDSSQEVLEIAGINPVLFPTYKGAVVALGQGRLDAVVMDEPVMLYYRKDLGLLHKIEWARGHPVVDRQDLALPVLKGDEVLVRILNKGLAEASGAELKQIGERWLRR